jgi:GNAT superfamily N-acetyltransferase
MSDLPMKVNIRDARPDDCNTIIEFNSMLSAETEDTLLDRVVLSQGVERLLADPSLGRYFLAEDDDDRIVGQLAHTMEWSDWRNGMIWWLQSVYVLESCRGQGVFRALFEHLRTLAQASPDVCGLRLYIERNNQDAMAVYRSLSMDDAGYLVMQSMLQR